MEAETLTRGKMSDTPHRPVLKPTLQCCLGISSVLEALKRALGVGGAGKRRCLAR